MRGERRRSSVEDETMVEIWARALEEQKCQGFGLMPSALSVSDLWRNSMSDRLQERKQFCPWAWTDYSPFFLLQTLNQ